MSGTVWMILERSSEQLLHIRRKQLHGNRQQNDPENLLQDGNSAFAQDQFDALGELKDDVNKCDIDDDRQDDIDRRVFSAK